jgi:SAM-dependent methyltransferase
MTKLELWKDPWPLDEQQCPCDVHFTRFLAAKALTNQRIFHLGTGLHHHVGLQAPASGHAVLGITASADEYQAYIDLAVNNPHLGKSYKVLFSDIYQTNAALLPPVFDIVTLFHLCEFWFESNAPYAAMNDQGVLETLTQRVVPGGLVLFYTGSFAYDAAALLIDPWFSNAGFAEETPFETLRIFRKTGFAR